MTPQEEEALVQVIVQCVRAVFEAFAGETRGVIPREHEESSVSKSPPGSRFIDVMTPQAAFKNPSMNGAARISIRNRDDVREALQRFLRNSEPVALEPKPESQQKRQLITQADILTAYKQGHRVILLHSDAIVTPLARQTAKDKGVELKSSDPTAKAGGLSLTPKSRDDRPLDKATYSGQVYHPEQEKLDTSPQ